MSLRVRPVCVGTLIGQQQAATTYLHGWDRTRDVPCLCFVIEGGESPVVVDTGPPDPEGTMRNHGYLLQRPPDQEPRRALVDAGVDLDAVKLVIYTHLHWDHVYNSELFQNARFVVQRAELTYAIDPLPVHRAGYEKLPGVQPAWFPIWDRLVTVEGDVPSLGRGISLVTLPGHTPGLQGVLVETAHGRYVLTSDCCDTYENWEGGPAVPHIPSAVHTSLFDYDESFAKLELLAKEGWEIVPGHDRAVVDRGIFE